MNQQSQSPSSTLSGLHLALLEPEIPPNTGNIARLCLATFTPLHLVGRLGFRTDRRAVLRAGLDYWDDADIRYHRDLNALSAALPNCRFVYVETSGSSIYTDFSYAAQDCLVFGCETKGLPAEIVEANRERCVSIPMPNPRVRSLNLATSAGIVLYEALRQIGFPVPPEE